MNSYTCNPGDRSLIIGMVLSAGAQSRQDAGNDDARRTGWARADGAGIHNAVRQGESTPHASCAYGVTRKRRRSSSGLMVISGRSCSQVSRDSQSRSEERRPLRRRPQDCNFGSLIMLAVTAGAFLLVTWSQRKPYCFSSNSLQFLEDRLAKTCFGVKRLSWVCSTMRGWPSKRSSPRGQDPPRGPRSTCCSLYITAQKWDMAAAVANHLVKG